MRMKKILATVLSMAMIAGLVTFSNEAVKADSTLVHDTTVNVVDNITSSESGKAVDIYEWPEGKEHQKDVYKVKFTLEKPAYVKFAIVSTICNEPHKNLGLLYSPTLETVEGVAIKDLKCDLAKGEANDEYAVLEAGTYCVTYSGKTSATSTGTVSTSISAQYVTRTGNVTGASPEKAFSLKAGEFSTGLITKTYKDQYFELKLTKKSTVSFDVITSVPSTFSEFRVKYSFSNLIGADLTEGLQKQAKKGYIGIEAYSFGYDYPASGTTAAVTLNAGTYYFKISMDKNEGEVKVKANVVAERVVPKLATPKLKKFKKGTKKIVGKATKGATVKVVVGKKPYTVKANKKGTFTVKLKSKLKKNVRIKVSVKLKGYLNSKAVTYRVK